MHCPCIVNSNKTGLGTSNDNYFIKNALLNVSVRDRQPRAVYKEHTKHGNTNAYLARGSHWHVGHSRSQRIRRKAESLEGMEGNPLKQVYMLCLCA